MTTQARAVDVASVCSRHVMAVDSRQTLQHAALLMREHHVGAVLVTESRAEGTHVIGVVTDRDLAIEVLARGGDASQVPVARLAQSPPIGVPGHAGLEAAVQAMATHGVRRLLVHDDSGQLLGVVTLDDLLPALAAPLLGLAEVIRSGREREAAQRGELAAAARPVLRVPAMGTAGWQQPTSPLPR